MAVLASICRQYPDELDLKLYSLAIIVILITSLKGPAMATPQSGQPIQAGSADQLAVIQQLLGTLFGQQQTVTNSANIAPLQQLLGQLQGADYSQMLNSIFMQAGGAIPGLQAAYTNAVGARSGNNSAVQANLERLLQQTSMLAQQKLAEQQLQNQQIQANVGGNIAQATASQKTATPGKAGELAGVLALAQGALKLTGSKDLEELWKKMGGSSAGVAGGTAGATTAAAAAPLSSAPAAMTTGAEAPQMSLAPWVGQSSTANILGDSGASAPDFMSPDFYFPEGGMSIAPDMAPFDPLPIENFSPAPSQWFEGPDLMQYF